MKGETIRIEYARRIDCTANGCETPHPDDGWIMPVNVACAAPGPDPRTVYRINGHVVTWVTRTVVESPWVDYEWPTKEAQQ